MIMYNNILYYIIHYMIKLYCSITAPGNPRRAPRESQEGTKGRPITGPVERPGALQEGPTRAPGGSQESPQEGYAQAGRQARQAGRQARQASMQAGSQTSQAGRQSRQARQVFQGVPRVSQECPSKVQ